MENIIGKRYGRLVVIKWLEKRKSYNYYLCQCDCGNIKIAELHNMKNGRTKSCGCMQKENWEKGGIIHGQSYTKLYRVYKGIINRCYYRNHIGYMDYGGRGIQVCDAWKANFVNFYDWALSNGYKEKLTIDRIDVNGNYEPSNCRWTTYKEQANNKRNNNFLIYKGEKHTITEWARILNCSRGMLRGRIKKGWTVEQILFTPKKRIVGNKAS